MSRALGPLAGAADFGFTPSDYVPAWHAGVLLGAARSGGWAEGVRAVTTEATYAGDMVQAFGGDFYGRVHYSFVLADLGNVIGEQTRTLSVWNAFLRAERLNSITASNADGLTLTGGPALPGDFRALQAVDYTITVDVEGPAVVDASYTFDWQTADGVVRLQGVRITAWSFRPDWSSSILERLEWRTDVLQAFNAKEQRRATRLAPRKAYEFEVFMTNAERRYAESTMWGWGARVWALPVWPDGAELAAALPAGSSSISVDTTARDYVAGGLAMLIADAMNFETVEVLSVSAGAITLARPTTNTWPQGTMVLPARTARLAQAARLSRWTGDASGMRAAFDLVDPVDFTPNAGAASYRNLPVLERRPDWSGGLELELSRKLAELDNLVGRRVYEDEAAIPLPMHSMRWMLASKAEQAAFRGLLYALRGRQGAAWVPTWTNDLQVLATIDLAATAIDVAFCNYSRQVEASTGRRDLRIELANGSVFYRRVLSAAQLNATTERLVIDSALGVTVQPGQVASISFMALCRLESDTVELAYWTGDTADVATMWRGFQHDL